MDSSRKRVLIVDDEPDFAFVTGQLLEQAGTFETRCETDSSRALCAAREYRPDLILLDVMMPDADGGDVLAELRADPETRDIPVIFLTALVGDGESPPGGLPSGGHCFLSKTLDPPHLIRRIEEAIAPAIAAQ